MRYKCMKFQPIALTMFNLQRGHEIAFTYVTREIIWKIYMQELCFVHDTSSQCALQMYEVSLKYL